MEDSGNDHEPEIVAIFNLTISMLAGPAVILSIMFAAADFSGSMATSLTGYGVLMAVMMATGLIMLLTAITERIIDPRLSNMFSGLTAIILAALSVQYVIDQQAELHLITEHLDPGPSNFISSENGV